MKTLLPYLAFVLGAVLLTILAVRFVDRGPWQRSVTGTEAVYWQAAKQAASSSYEPKTVSLPPPLYPYLLAPLTSDDLGAVRRARRILTSIALPLLALLALSLARRRAGAWASAAGALGVLIAAPTVLGAGTLTPAVPASLLALLALVVLDGGRNTVVWIAAGGLAGLAARFHPGLGWALVILLLSLAVFSPGRPRRLLGAGVFTLAWLTVVAVSGPVIDAAPLFPRITGTDIYRGHRAEASGVDPRRGDRDQERWWSYLDYLREASRQKGGPTTLKESDRHWTGQAVRDVFRHPHKELARDGVKVLAAFQGDALPREVSVAFLEERSETNGIRFIRWAGRILIPLGLVGMILGRRRSGKVLVVGVLSGLLAALITYAEADTRLVTVTCLLAGVGLLIDELRRGPGRARGIAAGVSILALLVWGLWPALGGVPGMNIQSEDYFYLAALYDLEQRGSTAIREYERALRLDPQNPYPRLAIGGMLARDNVYVEAIKELERLREDHPDFIPGLQALTRLYQTQERWGEAAAVYGHLIELEPWSPEHWNNLGTMYVQMGIYDQALRALERALEVDPDYETARDNLNGLRQQGLAPGAPSDADPLRRTQEQVLEFIRTGDMAGAEAALQAAYEQFGRDRAEFIYLEGTLRLVSGEPARAVVKFESIREKMATNVLFLNNMGAAYIQVKEFGKAKEVFEAALRLQPSNLRIQQGLKTVKTALDSLGQGGR
jgi:tetratricopeptide (TPR) repeat protein